MVHMSICQTLLLSGVCVLSPFDNFPSTSQRTESTQSGSDENFKFQEKRKLALQLRIHF